jgi:hypothetical protein
VLATTRDIWERKNSEEYEESEYIYIEEEDEEPEERGGIIWIEGGTGKGKGKTNDTIRHDISTRSFLTCYFSARFPERHPLGCIWC